MGGKSERESQQATWGGGGGEREEKKATTAPPFRAKQNQGIDSNDSNKSAENVEGEYERERESLPFSIAQKQNDNFLKKQPISQVNPFHTFFLGAFLTRLCLSWCCPLQRLTGTERERERMGRRRKSSSRVKQQRSDPVKIDLPEGKIRSAFFSYYFFCSVSRFFFSSSPGHQRRQKHHRQVLLKAP